MLFNSYQFILIFLPIALALYYFIGIRSHKFSLLFLAVISIFFYGYWSINSLPVLIISILVNYFLGMILARNNLPNKKLLLYFGIIFNLLVLGYFKYVNFFIDNVNTILNEFNAGDLEHYDILLPIGLSFYTFTQIAFIVDCYAGKATEFSFTKYIIFVTFFPHLIAGPLIHHKQIIPQLTSSNVCRIDFHKMSIGVMLFTIGLFKKVMIADPLGLFVNSMFSFAELNFQPKFFLSWLGAVSYAFQLYFDFSGYSDMAVGLGLMFGIWLPINFSSPFKSKSIIDFWQRWHITLTKYVGEYLHTPITLKLMRVSDSRIKIYQIFYTLIFPTLFIFVLLGLWHGANWTFVIFGALHGLYVVVNHLFRTATSKIRKKIESKLIHKIFGFLSWLVTMVAVLFSFVMFRSNNVTTAINIYKGMLGFNGILLPNLLSNFLGLPIDKTIYWLQVRAIGSEVLILLSISALICMYHESTADIHFNSGNNNLVNKILSKVYFPLLFGIIFVITILSISRTSSFLYFQF